MSFYLFLEESMDFSFLLTLTCDVCKLMASHTKIKGVLV